MERVLFQLKYKLKRCGKFIILSVNKEMDKFTRPPAFIVQWSETGERFIKASSHIIY